MICMGKEYRNYSGAYFERCCRQKPTPVYVVIWILIFGGRGRGWLGGYHIDVERSQCRPASTCKPQMFSICNYVWAEVVKITTRYSLPYLLLYMYDVRYIRAGPGRSNNIDINQLCVSIDRHTQMSSPCINPFGACSICCNCTSVIRDCVAMFSRSERHPTIFRCLYSGDSESVHYTFHLHIKHTHSGQLPH